MPNNGSCCGIAVFVALASIILAIISRQREVTADVDLMDFLYLAAELFVVTAIEMWPLTIFVILVLAIWFG